MTIYKVIHVAQSAGGSFKKDGKDIAYTAGLKVFYIDEQKADTMLNIRINEKALKELSRVPKVGDSIIVNIVESYGQFQKSIEFAK